MSFNVDFTHANGWGRALLDDKDWRDAGLRYTSQLDLLPFGQLNETERGNEAAYQRLFSRFITALQSLKESGHYQWILLDLPHGAASLTRQLLAQCDHVLSIANVDANCHIRLHQQPMPANAHILINASKQPLGEYRSDSLAAEEILTLANWCLLHFAKRPEPAGSSV